MSARYSLNGGEAGLWYLFDASEAPEAPVAPAKAVSAELALAESIEILLLTDSYGPSTLYTVEMEA